MRMNLLYPLYIILRYEIEKELFDGNIEVKDLLMFGIKNERVSRHKCENDARRGASGYA